MEQTAIEFKNVTKLYGEGGTKAVDDISFEIKEGEFITVLGSSGSGKTTTLKMINRLIREDDRTHNLLRRRHQWNERSGS